ncbi:hypothetical protein H8959_005595 [Pygathrix nigripes]
MGHLSTPLHRVRVPWQGLLLTASLLTFWNPPTTAQLTIESRPFNVAEGKEVLLLAHNLPQNSLGFSWYKGERVDAKHLIVAYVMRTQQTTPGPAHSGRETVYSNVSLLIQNVTQNDTGSYTIQAIKEDLVNEEATGQFRVYQLSPVAQPQIKASKTTVTEDKDSVNLTCSTNDTGISISWFFKDQSLPSSERMKLSQDNTTLSINPVKREDAGKYSCEVFNLISKNRSDPIMLTVNYNDPAQENGLTAGAIAGIVIGVLALVVLIVAALACFLHFRKAGRASDQRDLTEHKPSVSNHTQDHSNDPPNKMNEVTYSTLNFEAQQPTQPTSASSSPTAAEIIYSEVKKK